MIIVLVTMMIIVLATMMILVCDGHPDHDDDDISLQCNVRQKHMFDSAWEPTFIHTMRIIRWLSFTSLTSTNSNIAYFLLWLIRMMGQCQLIDLIDCVRVFEVILTKWNGQEEEKDRCLAAFSNICNWQSPFDHILIDFEKILGHRLIRRERTRLKFRTTHMLFSINNFWPELSKMCLRIFLHKPNKNDNWLTGQTLAEKPPFQS